MGTIRKTEQIEKYESLLTKKKNNIVKKKKSLPYFLTIAIFLFLGFFNHLEDLFYKFFGRTTDFIILLIGFFFLLAISYITWVFVSIRKKEKEMKSIKVKMYDLMKL